MEHIFITSLLIKIAFYMEVDLEVPQLYSRPWHRPRWLQLLVGGVVLFRSGTARAPLERGFCLLARWYFIFLLLNSRPESTKDGTPLWRWSKGIWVTSVPSCFVTTWSFCVSYFKGEAECELWGVIFLFGKCLFIHTCSILLKFEYCHEHENVLFILSW